MFKPDCKRRSGCLLISFVTNPALSSITWNVASFSLFILPAGVCVWAGGAFRCHGNEWMIVANTKIWSTVYPPGLAGSKGAGGPVHRSTHYLCALVFNRKIFFFQKEEIVKYPETHILAIDLSVMIKKKNQISHYSKLKRNRWPCFSFNSLLVCVLVFHHKKFVQKEEPEASFLQSTWDESKNSDLRL